MTAYRAIVSITFDKDDLQDLADNLGINVDKIDPLEAITGSMDNIDLGSAWVEQLFKDGNPTITRLSGGISVEINEHE
jgi:hypothetical protein